MRRQSDLDDIYGVKRRMSNPLDKDNDVPETGFRHSDSYHRYFRGYTEIRVPKADGRFQIQRYYTQPWIVSTASDRDHIGKRVWMLLLLAASWAAYVWSMCLPLGSNRWWITAIPGLISAIMLVLLSAVTVGYLCARRKMTLWEYASTAQRLKRISAITGGCMAMTVPAKLVFLLRYGGDAPSELLSSVAALAAALAAAGMYLLERKTVYTTIPNDTVLPEGEAHEIW